MPPAAVLFAVRQSLRQILAQNLMCRLGFCLLPDASAAMRRDSSPKLESVRPLPPVAVKFAARRPLGWILVLNLTRPLGFWLLLDAGATTGQDLSLGQSHLGRGCLVKAGAVLSRLGQSCLRQGCLIKAGVVSSRLAHLLQLRLMACHNFNCPLVEISIPHSSQLLQLQLLTCHNCDCNCNWIVIAHSSRLQLPAHHNCDCSLIVIVIAH